MSDKIHIQTVAEVHSFFGYPEPKHPLVSVLPIDEVMMTANYGDHTYIFDLYQISLKKGIQGNITYGRNHYDFHNGTIVFTQPNQSLKMEVGEDYSNASGWTIVFHPDLIRKSELGRIIDQYSFFSYSVNEALHLSEEEQESLTELAFKIEKEYQQKLDRHSQELMVSNIKMLLDYCTRYYDRQFYTRTNLSQDLVTRFEGLLSDYFKEGKQNKQGVPSVKYFGAAMNMSAHYLSDLLKKETNRSAQDHIYFHLINKAKTRLLNSEQTISQVAYSLGFEYPNHFSKLFKSKTGMSPAEFRSLN